MHPQYLVDETDRMIVKAAHLYRDGVMPGPGALLEQSARVIAAIETVTGAWALLEAARNRKEV